MHMLMMRGLRSQWIKSHMTMMSLLMIKALAVQCRLSLKHDADQKQFVQLADVVSITTRMRVGVDLLRGIMERCVGGSHTVRVPLRHPVQRFFARFKPWHRAVA